MGFSCTFVLGYFQVRLFLCNPTASFMDNYRRYRCHPLKFIVFPSFPIISSFFYRKKIWQGETYGIAGQWLGTLSSRASLSGRIFSLSSFFYITALRISVLFNCLFSPWICQLSLKLWSRLILFKPAPDRQTGRQTNRKPEQIDKLQHGGLISEYTMLDYYLDLWNCFISHFKGRAVV